MVAEHPVESEKLRPAQASVPRERPRRVTKTSAMNDPVPTATKRAVPLYQQVEQYLREQIVSGALRRGDMLPQVKDLCEKFGGINHLTVRQAIKNLSEENLVKTIHGRGSFVSEELNRHERIVILLPHLENTLHVSIAQGAQEIFTAHGLRSLILDSQGSEATEVDHIANLKDLPLGGALIFPIPTGNVAEHIFALKRDSFEFVLVDRYFEDIATPCVVVDNYRGGYESARHLALSKCRVAWIGESHSTPARQRLEGFRTALNDAGIACPSIFIKSIEVFPNAPKPYHLAQREAVWAAIDELMTLQPPIDGLACSDDFNALATLERLQILGVKVPEQMAVIGFDDIPAAARSSPALTTIRQPMKQLGREAASMLLERLKDKKLPIRKQTLPIELVVRESA